MIDYQGDVVALAEFDTALSAAAFAQPSLAKAQQADTAALQAHPHAALCGGLCHHILVHAASDGAELDLLHKATELWAKGTHLCESLADIRAALEQAMADPAAPGAATTFNNAAERAQQIGYQINAIRPEIEALRDSALKFPHLPAHPRQSDLPISQWDWGNLFHARRTDAFVRAVFAKATGPAERAFAIGTSVAYGANASGSAYIGYCVGGPRRSHRHRDRLARNVFGQWLTDNNGTAKSPQHIRDELPAKMPHTWKHLISTALTDTFDSKVTGPLPDIDKGYHRLREHLKLLGQFTLPPTPTPPTQTWMARLFSDPNSFPPSLRPQDVDVVGQDGGGVAVQYGSDPTPGSQTPGKDDSTSAGSVCGVIALVLILVDVVQAFIQCIGQWATGNTCTFWKNMLTSKLFEQDPPDPRDPGNQKPISTSEEALSTLSVSDQAAQLVWMLFDAHNSAWEAMSRAYNFLALTGLIMPAGLLGLPLYAQFTALPLLREGWPHEPEADPEHTYHLPPRSPLEMPPGNDSPFQVFSTPAEYITHATSFAMSLWTQVALGEHDSDNRDLDADRGFGYHCWATVGSINSNPIGIEILQYGEL
ncbi:MAG: hypothetical protein AB7G47_19570 [Mycolicibacterium sp.]|uniref:hypothetical protein n=1 Tax=Mycolicibacterium sp. TaxID=2320850 RepID=UPI003D10390F